LGRSRRNSARLHVALPHPWRIGEARNSGSNVARFGARKSARQGFTRRVFACARSTIPVLSGIVANNMFVHAQSFGRRLAMT
jgi:hypothetical protein